MAEQLTRQDVIDIITEYEQQYGSTIGDGTVHELTQAELTDENLRVLTIPGMRPDTEEWVQTSMRNMMQPITHAVSDLSTLKTETNAAKEGANQAASNANTAAGGAANVNAVLVGMIVTVTDRNGVSRSSNIGFNIAPENVYGSKAAMLADAANVLAGKFCIIATTDPTDPDNATLWIRNNQPATAEDPYTFLSDLDQAATDVWEDWNTNLRQQIVQATADANSAATRANTAADRIGQAADEESVRNLVKNWTSTD